MAISTSTVHNSARKVIEEQTLWETVCRVWLPNQDAVVRAPRSALRSLSSNLQPEIRAGRIAYVAAAAKIQPQPVRGSDNRRLGSGCSRRAHGRTLMNTKSTGTALRVSLVKPVAHLS